MRFGIDRDPHEADLQPPPRRCDQCDAAPELTLGLCARCMRMERLDERVRDVEGDLRERMAHQQQQIDALRRRVAALEGEGVETRATIDIVHRTMLDLQRLLQRLLQRVTSRVPTIGIDE